MCSSNAKSRPSGGVSNEEFPKNDVEEVSLEEWRSVASSKHPAGTVNSSKGGKRIKVSKSSFEDVFFQPDDEDPNEFGLIRQSESLKNSRSIAVDPNKRQTVLQDEDFVDDSDGEAAADDSPIFGFGGAD